MLQQCKAHPSPAAHPSGGPPSNRTTERTYLVLGRGLLQRCRQHLSDRVARDLPAGVTVQAKQSVLLAHDEVADLAGRHNRAGSASIDGRFGVQRMETEVKLQFVPDGVWSVLIPHCCGVPLASKPFVCSSGPEPALSPLGPSVLKGSYWLMQSQP